MKRIRSNHNSLLNYFIHDRRDLSPAYVRSCEKFFKELSRKRQAASTKRQASSLTKVLGFDGTKEQPAICMFRAGRASGGYHA